MTLFECATPIDTDDYHSKYPDIPFVELGATRLMVSQVGFGSYRVDTQHEAQRDALQHALSSGINLVDTSANYGDGDAETLIGEVLHQLIGSQVLYRENIVIVSKGGYIQGQNYSRYLDQKEAGNVPEEVLEFQEGLAHCISPTFLRDQIDRSLDRLGVESIDVYLLHNPEYYLEWAHQQGHSVDDARQEYYRRIRTAFEYLEQEVAEGRIQYYGVSSNTFGLPESAPTFTSLTELMAQAESVSSGHFFRVIQCPMNVLETGVATEPNQNGKTVLEIATEVELGVLINRPLNALSDDRLIRLASYDPPESVDVSDLHTHIHALEGVQRRLAELISDDAASSGLEALDISTFLQENWETFQGLAHWQSTVDSVVFPRIEYGISTVMNTVEPTPDIQGAIEELVKGINGVCRQITAYYQRDANLVSTSILESLHDIVPGWVQGRSLSQSAIRALRSTLGISCTLVGMRKRDYVDDVLTELRRPIEIDDRRVAWQKVSDSV